MEQPLVTVVIPMYNVEAYIAECLESLLAQTYPHFEAICVENGSTDATLARARETVGDDERFIFIEHENKGQSAARNAALDVACGTYVVNLDADDYYVPETLETLVSRMKADDLDLVFFAASTFYETRELRRTHPEKQDNRQSIPGVFTGPELYVRFEETGAFRPSACMFMIKRDLLETAHVRFEEGIIHEDLLFTMQVFPLAQRAAFENVSLYRRRMREGSTMTSPRGIKNIHGLFTVAQRLGEWFSANQNSFQQDFCDAFTHRLFDTWVLAARDVPTVDPDELMQYRETLTPEQRAAFNLHVLELGIALHEEEQHIRQSTTFKVGHLVMGPLTWVKSRVILPD